MKRRKQRINSKSALNNEKDEHLRCNLPDIPDFPRSTQKVDCDHSFLTNKSSGYDKVKLFGNLQTSRKSEMYL